MRCSRTTTVPPAPEGLEVPIEPCSDLDGTARPIALEGDSGSQSHRGPASTGATAARGGGA